MADLFTLPELASYLQRDLDTASATLAREIATGIVLDAVGPVDAATSTLTLPVDCDGIIALPVATVTDVTSVVIAGSSVGFVWERPFPRVRLTSYTIPTATLNGALWPTADVTIDHGWASVPLVVKAVALSVAARAYDNPRGMRSESIDDYSGTRAGSDDDLAGITLTESETATLARYAPGSYVTSA